MYKSIQNIYKLLLIFFNILLISVLFSIYKIKISLYLGFFLIFIFQIFLILKYLNFDFYRILEKILIAKIISLFIFIYSNNTLCKSKFNVYIENTNITDNNIVKYIGLSLLGFIVFGFFITRYSSDFSYILEKKKSYLDLNEKTSFTYEFFKVNLNKNQIYFNSLNKLKINEFSDIKSDITILNNFSDKLTFKQFDSLLAFIMYSDRKNVSNVSNNILFFFSKYNKEPHTTFTNFVMIPKKNKIESTLDFIFYDILCSDFFLVPIINFFYIGNLFFGLNVFSTFNYNYFYKLKQNHIHFEKLLNDYQNFYNTSISESSRSIELQVFKDINDFQILKECKKNICKEIKEFSPFDLYKKPYQYTYSEFQEIEKIYEFEKIKRFEELQIYYPFKKLENIENIENIENFEKAPKLKYVECQEDEECKNYERSFHIFDDFMEEKDDIDISFIF